MTYLIIFILGFGSGALSVVTWALVVACKRYEEERKEQETEDS